MSFHAQYYDGKNFQLLKSERLDSTIDIRKKEDLPSEIKDRKHVRGGETCEWSARWTKVINGPGKFSFRCITDDGMRIKVDGQYIINQWKDQGATEYKAEKYLSAGPHTIVIEYYQAGGGFRAFFDYDRIGGQSSADVRRNWELAKAPGPVTAGGLQPARLYEADEDGQPIITGSSFNIFYCQFNPATYAIQKAGKYSFSGKFKENRNYAFKYDLDKIEPSKLTIKELWFDTSEQYDRAGRPVDVRSYVDNLMSLAESTTNNYQGAQTNSSGAIAPPPKVAFHWGPVRFLGIIDTLTVKFTLFHRDGTPLRAKASLSMKEFRMRKAYPRQNPSSGADETMSSVWQVTSGERLDNIAAQVYGDAALWRVIAQRNDIADPLALTPGQLLQLPDPEAI